MWRHLPPAIFVAGAALLLIAGATGDWQSWSDTLASQPWRSVFTTPQWATLAEVWQAGTTRLQATFAPHAAPTPAVGSKASGAVQQPQPALPQHMTPAPTSGPRELGQVANPARAAAPGAQLAAQVPTPRQRLLDARQALAAGRATEAQQMLESAESQLTVQPTERFASRAERIDMPATWVSRALISLRSGDRPGALHDLDLAIAST